MSYLVIDFETTGLDAGDDEVLSCSIINEFGEVKLDVLCKPKNCIRWDDAEAVHGISPLMVVGKSPFETYVPLVKMMFDKVDYLVAYNVQFERSFLESYGIDTNAYSWIDPMIMFAEVYCEWSEKYNSYKWQSLGTCAAYYGYEFNVHNSLEDVKATLYCYKQMLDSNGFCDSVSCRREFDHINDTQYEWILFEDGSGSLSTNNGRLAIFDLQSREVDTGKGWIFTDICTFKDVKSYIYNVLGIVEGQ